MLNILLLCNLTEAMAAPWVAAGHRVTMVDVQHPAGAQADGLITRVGADLRTWRPPRQRWDAVFAFPPCTDLAQLGSQWWARKELENPGTLRRALGLVRRVRRLIHLTGTGCWFIENPVGRLSAHWRGPDYTFQPWEYGGYLSPPGDRYTKFTCLWTGPRFAMPAIRPVTPTEGSKMHRLAPGPQRANLRSATPAGFALAVFQANEPHLLGRELAPMTQASLF